MDIESQKKLLLDYFSFLQGKSVCIFDAPTHPNKGDSAIFLGQLELLTLLGCRLVEWDFDNKADFVLMSGGGNLGDLYMHREFLRMYQFAIFRDKSFVIFPQSVCYLNSQYQYFAIELLKRIPRLTLCLRDQKSLEKMDGVPNKILLPDMATMLGPLKPAKKAIIDVLILVRADREAEKDFSLSSCTSGLILHLQNKNLSFKVVTDDEYLKDSFSQDKKHIVESDMPKAHQNCKIRVEEIIDLISTFKIIITDQLHGHIFSYLMDKPNIIIDNNYGKIKSYHTTWTTSHTKSFFVDNFTQLVQCLDKCDQLS